MRIMRYIGTCLLLLCAVSSWGQCLSAYNRAIRNYNEKKFIEARQTFIWCQSYCSNDLDQGEVSKYIGLCDKGIDDAKKALAAKRKRIAEQEEQSRKQVEKNKWIYFSCDAAIFDNVYTRFGSEITMALTKRGYKFTRDKEKALWQITLTAVAHKDKNIRNERTPYQATVDAIGTIYNTIEETEFPFAESDRFATDKSFEEAAEWVFRKGELRDVVIQDICLILQM